MVQHAAAEDEGIAGFQDRPQPVRLWMTGADLGIGEGSDRTDLLPANSMPGASSPQGVRAIQQVSMASRAPSVEVAPRKSKPRAPS